MAQKCFLLAGDRGNSFFNKIVPPGVLFALFHSLNIILLAKYCSILFFPILILRTVDHKTTIVIVFVVSSFSECNFLVVSYGDIHFAEFRHHFFHSSSDNQCRLLRQSNRMLL